MDQGSNASTLSSLHALHPAKESASVLKTLGGGMSNAGLEDIVANDDNKLRRLVEECNRAGVDLIRSGDFGGALQQLHEAESILKCAVNYGRSVERGLIAAILHNGACASQKLQKLYNCADYLEALIYNTSSFLQKVPLAHTTASLCDPHSNHSHHLAMHLHQCLETTAYHLQYSAISSQIGNHKSAISSAKKGLRLLDDLLAQAHSYQNLVSGKTDPNSWLLLLGADCRGIDEDTLPRLLSECKKHIRRCKEGDGKETVEGEQAVKQEFWMGHITEMEPMTTLSDEEVQAVDNLLSRQNMYRMVFYVSIAYFTIATELRLMNSSRAGLRKAWDMEVSKVYHLNALRVAVAYVPCIGKYAKHIHQGLQNHFGINLMTDVCGYGFQAPETLQVSDVLLSTSGLLRLSRVSGQNQIDLRQYGSTLKPQTEEITHPVQCSPNFTHKSQKKYISTIAPGRKPKGPYYPTLQKQPIGKPIKTAKLPKGRSKSGDVKKIKKVPSEASLRLKYTIPSSSKNPEPQSVQSRKRHSKSQKSSKSGQKSHQKMKNVVKKGEERKKMLRKRVEDQYNMGNKQKKKQSQRSFKSSVSSKKSVRSEWPQKRQCTMKRGQP